jgi:phospholipase C
MPASENRSFDHIFGTYQPRAGQSVWNLLSIGIVDANGKPGPNYAIANQFMAMDTDLYSIHPGYKTLYPNVPAEFVGGPKSASDTLANKYTLPDNMHQGSGPGQRQKA